MADLRIDVDIGEAKDVIDEVPDELEGAMEDTIRQLSVLAEAAIKDEAPEGAGRDKHLRDTVDTRFGRGGLRADIGPRKRVGDDEILLAEILGGDPSWSADNPPPLGPLRDWTEAKWGDGSVAAAMRLRNSLVEDGMESAPNPFVERAYETWKTQVGDVAGDNVKEAMARLQGL